MLTYVDWPFLLGMAPETAAYKTGSQFWRLFINSDHEKEAIDFVSINVGYWSDDERMKADISLCTLSCTIVANARSADFPIAKSCRKHSLYLLV